MAETVCSVEDVAKLKDNVVLGTLPTRWDDFRIVFKGKGNVLFLEEGVKLGDGSIDFSGDNALVVLRKSRHLYKLNLIAWKSTFVYLGEECYYNGRLNAIASEGQQIVVGRGCLFSFGVWMRTADPHLVYDVTTHERMNPSASIVLGDHVWVGQGSTILKGSQIGSGTLLGTMAVVAGKRLPSNGAWAGNPARCVRQGIFWEGSSVHNYGPEQTAQKQTFPGDDFIFAQDEQTVDAGELLATISAAGSAAERLEAVQASALWNGGKNRFFRPVAEGKKRKLLRRLLRR